MSYNFKKIMDLDLVTEVPEGANVLIETDGATKRLPSTAINNGYSKEEVYNKTEADNIPTSTANFLLRYSLNVATFFNKNSSIIGSSFNLLHFT